MATVKHVFTSAASDGADATLVRPSNWNADHTFTVAATARLLGRATAGAGAVEEIALGAGLALSGTTLNTAVTVKKLGVAHSNSTVTLSTITDGTSAWSHSVVAGKSYTFKVIGNYQTAALTTGAKLAVTATTAVGTVAGSAWGAIGQATVATGLEATIYSVVSGAAGTFVLTSGVTAINSPHNIGMEFVFNCTTSGTLAIQFASEVALSAAQLNIGSVLIVEEII